MKRIYSVAVVALVSCIGCRDEFDAGIREQSQSFLVVEGNLNAGNDSTKIWLTRTIGLEAATRIIAENNAVLTVEGKDNTTRPLIVRGNGLYVSPNLNLTIGTEYRLRIKTSNGKEYLSEYVKARATPPIDSINKEEIDGQLWVYANTHDPSGSSRYYRWDFDETWQIRSSYYSYYVYENSINYVRSRNFPAEEVYHCWKYDTSKTILLANSTNLLNDVIFKMPLTYIETSSEKVAVRYSIQVSQYALDKQAYNFFELMKKNTEEIGSVFSPQPSELAGNIRCVSDPLEYVLGYVTASTVEKKRAFFVASRPGFRMDCPTKIVTADSVIFYFKYEDYIPYDYDLPNNFFYASLPTCVDCRKRGGSLIKPSYW
jgi:hypothetical protein